MAKKKFRKFTELCELDQRLRKAFPKRMFDGVDVTIKKEMGYEKYGSYDCWGDGYVIEWGPGDDHFVYRGKKRVEAHWPAGEVWAKNLDDAISEMEKKLQETTKLIKPEKKIYFRSLETLKNED